ncbi:uncharacterized protein V1516DRAFT_662668 [Lipomyces oligophaga]|uniref:uncharacterized protein n=1 Tax=Lipomyces oligophaga TaxID=45792 RepID=UPI0034D01EB5
MTGLSNDDFRKLLQSGSSVSRPRSEATTINSARYKSYPYRSNFNRTPTNFEKKKYPTVKENTPKIKKVQKYRDRAAERRTTQEDVSGVHDDEEHKQIKGLDFQLLDRIKQGDFGVEDSQDVGDAQDQRNDQELDKMLTRDIAVNEGGKSKRELLDELRRKQNEKSKFKPIGKKESHTGDVRKHLSHEHHGHHEHREHREHRKHREHHGRHIHDDHHHHRSHRHQNNKSENSNKEKLEISELESNISEAKHTTPESLKQSQSLEAPSHSISSGPVETPIIRKPTFSESDDDVDIFSDAGADYNPGDDGDGDSDDNEDEDDDINDGDGEDEDRVESDLLPRQIINSTTIIPDDKELSSLVASIRAKRNQGLMPLQPLGGDYDIDIDIGGEGRWVDDEEDEHDISNKIKKKKKL